MPALAIAPEIAAALADRRAVVALESTLVTHGFAPPAGLEVARAAEQAVRAAGAVPATVAVVGGVLRVGLTAAELADLAADRTVAKASAGDLAIAVARGRSASTTVSATVFAAARAGIRVLATGGIGGVHRGDAGDVSNDLTVLAREPVAVVASGAKAILDLPRTLERLETLGVPVIGLGTDELPGFFTRRTGLRLAARADSAAEVAALLAARWEELGQEAGVLIANPPPAAAALAEEEVGAAVDAALGAAAARGVRSKELTPFLLAELARATGGRTVPVNRALIVENARAAAAISVAYQALRAARPS